MKKGQFVVMTKEFTTGCGKEYLVGHIGCLSYDVGEDDRRVWVRFPTHSSSDSSYLYVSDVKLADDQNKACKKFNRGEAKCEKVFY